jgi:SAM-dependent methyltransferase
MHQDPAATAYAQLAPDYDRFTAAHNHDDWVGALAELAREHGLRGRRVLDVACGTGNSLIPLIRRGFSATGCDISPEMLEVAAEKVGPDIDLLRADIRSLPAVGPYDLVLCAGDVLNYLLDADELTAALRSIRSVLAPGGVCVFDVNTLGAYATVFAGDRVISEDDTHLLFWRGTGDPEPAPGSRVEVTVEVFTAHEELWRRTSSTHVHRAHTDAEVCAALRFAGLACEATYGVTPDGRVHPQLDERAHAKRVYVASLPVQSTRKGGVDASDQEARVAGRAGGGVQQGQLTVLVPPGVNPPGGTPASLLPNGSRP